MCKVYRSKYYTYGAIVDSIDHTKYERQNYMYK